jgi:hypothetical protein
VRLWTNFELKNLKLLKARDGWVFVKNVNIWIDICHDKPSLNDVSLYVSSRIIRRRFVSADKVMPRNYLLELLETLSRDPGARGDQLLPHAGHLTARGLPSRPASYPAQAPLSNINFYNPILHTAWLDNHALPLKRNTAKYYFGEKSSCLHTFLKFAVYQEKFESSSRTFYFQC